MYSVTGNTYPYRTALKALGLRWDPAGKAWTTGNPAAYQQAIAIVGGSSLPLRQPVPRPEAEDIRILPI